jgi:hypothetical protein
MNPQPEEKQITIAVMVVVSSAQPYTASLSPAASSGLHGTTLADGEMG